MNKILKRLKKTAIKDKNKVNEIREEMKDLITLINGLKLEDEEEQRLVNKQRNKLKNLLDNLNINKVEEVIDDVVEELNDVDLSNNEINQINDIVDNIENNIDNVDDNNINDKANENYIYELKTNGTYDLIGDDTIEVTDISIDKYFPYEQELFDALSTDGMDLNFVDYIHDEQIANKLVSIKLDLNSDCTLQTIITAKEKLTPKDCDYLYNYMQGQFADGWGEGFEQREITRYDDDIESEQYDEEEDEYYTDYNSETIYVYVHWWGQGCKTEWDVMPNM